MRALHINDAGLVAQARSGDSDAFEMLVRVYEGPLRSQLLVALGDAATADDLVQESFLLAYRKLLAFDLSLPFFPWLKGIAANLLRNQIRNSIVHGSQASDHVPRVFPRRRSSGHRERGLHDPHLESRARPLTLGNSERKLN